MRGQLFFSAFAAGSAAAATIYESTEASLAARQTVSGACPDLHVLACGGANYTDPSAIGRLGSLARLIVSRVPNSDFVSVPYDKVQHGVRMLAPDAIDNGIVTFEQYVAQFSASCPQSKMAFVGYSSGAVITMGSFCAGSVPQSLAGTSVVAVTVYGDQTRVPGQPYDLGTGGQSCVGKDADKRDPATCGKFAPLIKSYCDTNDPECCGGPESDYMIHLEYPGKYDNTAADWVVNSYNAATGNGASNSSSSATGSATGSSASSTSTGGAIVGGGLGGSGTTTAASVDTSASASSMASALSALGTAASSTATSAASSAASSATSAASGASSAAASATSAAAGGASSAASGASSAANSVVSQASSTLTPANPNGASFAAPSFGLGAVAMIMVALF